MSLLLGWGAFAQDKNASARLCTKNAGGGGGGGGGGGLCARGTYLRDTTVHTYTHTSQCNHTSVGLAQARPNKMTLCS